MKKFTLFVMTVMGMAMSANAQYNVNGHKWTDNWSIGVDGGATTNIVDWTTPHGGVAGIQLTKAITPVVSFEFGVQAGFNNAYNWNLPHSKNVVDNLAVIASTKINLMNWFCGYKGAPRLFELQARGGFGWMDNFYPNKDGFNYGHDLNTAVAKVGLDFDFNVGKSKAWTISVRPAVVMRAQGHLSGCALEKNAHNKYRYGHNAVGQLTAGVTYHFKNSNGSHHFTTVEPQIITETVEKIVETPVVKEVIKEVEKKVAVGGTYVVEFAQNKSVLTDDAKNILNSIPAGTTVALDAFASPEGNKTYNEKLSQRRADEVKKYLEARNVKIAGVNAHGAVGNSSQRVVYVRVK